MFLRTVSRSPCNTVLIEISSLYVSCLVAWRETVFHCKRIQVRFDSRTHLTASHHSHVILEVVIVRSAHICLHISCYRVHRHKSGTQEVLIVFDRVKRSHDSILLTLISKHCHFTRSIESLHDFSIRISRSLHHTATLTLSD